jgi:hypothetical protein
MASNNSLSGKSPELIKMFSAEISIGNFSCKYSMV